MSSPEEEHIAERAIRAAERKLFGDAIERIYVGPNRNSDDEPGLFVTIFLKAGQQRMSGDDLASAIDAASAALQQLGDDRFAYVGLLSPEDESAEDTRPAA